MAKLPTPATSGEMFMNAAVEELQRLNRNIEKLLDALQPVEPVEQGEEVELKEPEKKPATRDAKQAADKATKKG